MSSSEPEFDVIVMEDVMIPSRDGIGLATDIYRPSRDGKMIDTPLPIILERTPYNKRSPDRVEKTARYFAKRGYIFAFQDCRGCFMSEGLFDFFWQEGRDGYDTLDWLGKQSWSNGAIGTTGTSYAGWTQTSLAALNPPYLTCMWVNEGPSNGYTSTVRQGGALELRFLTWLYWHAGINTNSRLKSDPNAAAMLDSADTRAVLKAMPIEWGQTALSAAPHYEKRAFDLLTVGDYNDLWKDPSVNFEMYWDQCPDVPIVFSSAWYDSYTRANLENFIGLTARKKGPIRLVMGPWTHSEGNMGLSYAGGVDLGTPAIFDYNGERLRWFDRWLKEIDNGVDEDSPVRIFVMGGGGGHRNSLGRMDHGGFWRSEQEWPLNRAEITTYYLQSEGSLGFELPSEPDASSGYRFDPNKPVPTIGGNVSSLSTLRSIPSYVSEPSWTLPQSARVEPIVVPGGWDQRERPDVFGATPPYNSRLSDRSDVLVFCTEKLERDVEVTGPIEVTLWVSSDAPDTDFTAKLVDVYPPNNDYPDGFELNISDGITRMRYRDSWDNPSFLVPGEIYQVTIVLYPTSNIFGKGHKLRLDVSSSNFPRFDVNPNTGEPLGQNKRVQEVENRVYHSSRYPSFLTLSIVGSPRD